MQEAEYAKRIIIFFDIGTGSCWRDFVLLTGPSLRLLYFSVGIVSLTGPSFRLFSLSVRAILLSRKNVLILRKTEQLFEHNDNFIVLYSAKGAGEAKA